MSGRVNLDRKASKDMLLFAGMKVARRPGGWHSLTRKGIADEAQCSEALVSLRLGTMDDARDEIMKGAIKYKYLDLIAQGIAAGHPLCLDLPSVLKHKAIASLV